MPAENNKSSQPAAIPVICGQKISVDFGQRKAVITIYINKTKEKRFNFSINSSYFIVFNKTLSLKINFFNEN